MNYYAYPWSRWLKWGIAAIIALFIVVGAISTYNGLAAADQEIQRNWSQVENVMQRRLDVLTNMAETVKGYTKHEEKVFSDIANARSVLMSSTEDIKSKTEADAKLSDAAGKLLLLVENYPELKASQQFTNLQVEIVGAENRVAVERMRFIDSVNKYNTKVRRFPASIFARLMGFSTRDYYQANPEAKDSPRINF